MSKRFLYSTLVSLLALLTVSAYAVDGVVLINQASVNAAGGFPYKITASGSYKLSSNLVVTGTADAIDVLADNVTIDMNGFSIIGPVVCDGDFNNVTTFCGTNIAGVGVLNQQQQNLTVRNGTIEGMLYAIENITAGGLIENVHAFKNGLYGIISNGVIRRCTATNNGGPGVLAKSGAVISENVVARNAGAGIIAQSDSTIIGNSSTSNRDSGIIAINSTVKDNVSNNNFGVGLSSAGGLFGSNSFSGNTAGSVDGTSLSQHNNNCDGTGC
jgi:hypothetical protein